MLKDAATVKRFQAVSRNGLLAEQATEKEARITKTKEEQLLPPIDSARKVEARFPDMLGK